MLLKRANNLILIFIILCSTGFYRFIFLGSMVKVIELIGIGTLVMLLAFHLVYGEQKVVVPMHFVLPVLLIIFSTFTSMFMAKYSRGQDFGETIFAQRNLYYYLLYFLLHQLRIKPRDLVIIFLGFGIFYTLLFLVQTALYPRIIFQGHTRFIRETVRIYLPGSGYLGMAIWIMAQYYYRTLKLKYSLVLLLFLIIIILSGGRKPLAEIVFTLVLFLMIDKRAKSKLFVLFMGIIAAGALFVMFRDIFEALFMKAQYDARLGDEYVRIRAAKFYLTDFFHNRFAYITGNGMFGTNSDYAREIATYNGWGFFASDIGIFGNYAIYGAFFVIGIFMMIVRSLKLKLLPEHTFLKLEIFTIILSLVSAPSLGHAHFIAFFMCIIYLADVSNYTYNTSNVKNKSQNNDLSNE